MGGIRLSSNDTPGDTGARFVMLALSGANTLCRSEPFVTGVDDSLYQIDSGVTPTYGHFPNRKMKYTVYKDNQGGFRWHLTAGNNRIIAHSGESYKNKDDCIDAMALVMNTTTKTPWYDLTK